MNQDRNLSDDFVSIRSFSQLKYLKWSYLNHAAFSKLYLKFPDNQEGKSNRKETSKTISTTIKTIILLVKSRLPGL